MHTLILPIFLLAAFSALLLSATLKYMKATGDVKPIWAHIQKVHLVFFLFAGLQFLASLARVLQ